MPSSRPAANATVGAMLLLAMCCILSPLAMAEPCTAKNQPPGCTAPVAAPTPAQSQPAEQKAATAAPADTKAPEQKAAAVPHQIVKAVYSLETFKHCYLEEWERGKAPSASSCKRALQEPQLALIGAGDIVVALDPAAYDAAAAHATKSGAAELVFFNGVELKDETQVSQQARFGDNVFIRIHLKPKEKAKVLWSAIIREAGITQAAPLRVGFGWQGSGVTSTTNYAGGHSPQIAVSNTPHLLGAIGAVALIVAFALAVGVHTDILRDRYPEALQTVVAEARLLRQQLDRLSLDGKNKLLSAAYPAYARGPDGVDDACRSAADTALRDPASARMTPELTIGLAESDISFSLTRIQLFAWFLFAVSAGIYFWFLLGELPAIDNSILGLLGISAGVAGVSWAVDASDKSAAKQPNAGLSKGLLSDMTRSAEDKDEIHRFQAIVVNILLLAIGAVHVVRSISYPTFDPTWLVFLTISGATFALGKQMNEKK